MLDPEEQIRRLVRQIDVSAIVAAVVPGRDTLDAKFVIELGVAVMLDKPIIALIQPGTPIPRKLAAVVDRFVEYHPGQIEELANAIRDAVADFKTDHGPSPQ